MNIRRQVIHVLRLWEHEQNVDILQNNFSKRKFFIWLRFHFIVPTALLDKRLLLAQVMAWGHQATSHYLNQRWPRLETHIDGLVQKCSISIANALEILQSCTKSTICASLILSVLFFYHVYVLNYCCELNMYLPFIYFFTMMEILSCYPGLTPKPA